MLNKLGWSLSEYAVGWFFPLMIFTLIFIVFLPARIDGPLRALFGLIGADVCVSGLAGMCLVLAGKGIKDK